MEPDRIILVNPETQCEEASDSKALAIIIKFDMYCTDNTNNNKLKFTALKFTEPDPKLFFHAEPKAHKDDVVPFFFYIF
jgi:hypothetical protein